MMKMMTMTPQLLLLALPAPAEVGRRAAAEVLVLHVVFTLVHIPVLIPHRLGGLSLTGVMK